ncbi:MAG: single-stranded-DNA-specific exonuclease RecJ, partial [Firmicutes bacterium]|nr:single-stranded-DNA-specific exonuclease RecJ [Bacillota bacterium]
MHINFKQKNSITLSEEKIREMSIKTHLSEKMVELLFLRGIETIDEIRNFLFPQENNLFDANLMEGMSELKERVDTAIKNGEKVLIYGDYDVDGICSASILSQYLISCGVEVFVHIPSRMADGYGLNIETLERLLDEYTPDLIITCDCGISNKEEIEFCNFVAGVDIIITDHHEPPPILPDCVIVNPKRATCPYPFKDLCGAGVALKVVEALGGREEALKYLDLAAIATIADLMPMTSENRLIVQLGLKRVKNLGLEKMLIKYDLNPQNLISSEVAYKIAPRINAAGRMGCAQRAFELLNTSDEKRIAALIGEINTDNEKRRELCETTYVEAIEILKKEGVGLSKKSVVLAHDKWEKGITGILAARLCGEFRRPTFVLVGAGDVYKGTARSVSGINIHDILIKCSDILVEFGGHAGAAGFSLEKKNLNLFKARLDEVLSVFGDEFFEPQHEYDTILDFDELTLEFAKELDRLEPFGSANNRPIFALTAYKLDSILPTKQNPYHTNITHKGKSILAFNFYNENQFLLGDSKKKLLVETSVNLYNNNEYVKTVLKAARCEELFFSEKVAYSCFLKNIEYISFSKKLPQNKTYQEKDLKDLIDEKYSILIVAGCKKKFEEAKRILHKKVQVNEFMLTSSINNHTRLVCSPLFDDENLILPFYKKIIFLDTPPDGTVQFLNFQTSAEIYLPEQNTKTICFKHISLEREVF